MSSLGSFLLIWGVWLITPVLVDGFDALWRLATVYANRHDSRSEDRPVADEDLPTLSVIIPCHNEAEVIDRCINSVKAQRYPHDKLEIIVIDDGSTDGTAKVVEGHLNGDHQGNSYILRGEPITVGPFHGTLALIKNGHAGKADALNAGLEASTGEVLVNIDSDVVLAPNAMRAIAEYFVRNPETQAATGNIEIDWEMVEERDRGGNLVLDKDGAVKTRSLNLWQRFLVRSQFLEYLTAFDLGRRSQSITGTMYSLAGACSAFRRGVFKDGLAYCNDTVSEDTCLTFELHNAGVRIGFVEDARIHLEPIIEWDALYAQRVRWARGQLEVVGVHKHLVGTARAGSFSRLAVPKMLLYDHTLAFPRLIWMPLIACFPLLGYSWRLLAIALLALYVFYLLIELVNSACAYAISEQDMQKRIERSEWAVIGLPVYRFVVFHFRFSGFLVTLTEPQEWTTQGPIQTARRDASRLRLRSVELVAGLFGAGVTAATRVARSVAAIVLPLLLTIVLLLLSALDHRRPG